MNRSFLNSTRLAFAGTLLAALFSISPPLSGQESPPERVVVVPWDSKPREAPLFFSADAVVSARITPEWVTTEQLLQFHIHQGKSGPLTLSLSGEGEVTEVRGEGLKDWAVRVTEQGERFLDLHPAEAEKFPVNFEVSVRSRGAVKDGVARVLLPGPASATGFSLKLHLSPDRDVDLRLLKISGLLAVEGSENREFFGAGASVVEVAPTPMGTRAAGVEVKNGTLRGKVADGGGSVVFALAGMVRADVAGARIGLLGAGAAPVGGVAGDGWHLELHQRQGKWVHEWVADRAGDLPLALSFQVPVRRSGDWHSLEFSLPAGGVVPVEIEGLTGEAGFDPNKAVTPIWRDGRWCGFLPANGQVEVAWRVADKVADGSLFFAGSETTDVRVGSGLLRQTTSMELRVLQGKLGEPTFSLDGPGEVLSVTGESVLGWKVLERAGKRELEVKLSRPISGAGKLTIEAQCALGALPVTARAMRLSPVGALRHSGWLRVSNEGAVRIEVTAAEGLIQLAPGQYPGKAAPEGGQAFVYRFPSADYRFDVQARQVLPEVAVTEVTIYELAETDRRISSDIELDIREAPLREWEMDIPADHAVAAVTGAEVADYAVAADETHGARRLRVFFKQAVSQRQLISVKLEKNQAAKAGAWELPRLGFPGVKSRRGSIGVVAAAGYRLTATQSSGVAEVPVTFFPKKTPGLQQAFRLREDTWAVALNVESLGQSIQADVFHLYSLQSGVITGSVLMNFFVIGSPATEWRISVPEGVGNIDVTGQGVGRDWRREGDTVIVPLSRPILGAGTLLLTFGQPMSPGGGRLAPGAVTPLGVQGERGFVQVVSPLQVNHKETSRGSLMAIDASELPTEFRLLSSAPTIGAWQYTARDFEIGMEIEWFAPGETVGQVVDFQKLTSRVSRDGQWVTDATVFVKSRSNGALRMAFPEGASLWEAKVDGQAVNARSDGAATLIPMPNQLRPDQSVEVSLRYGARPKDGSKPKLEAPRISAPVVMSEWRITGDDGRQLVPRGGTANLTRPPLAENGWDWLNRHTEAGLAWLAAGLLGWGLARKPEAGKLRMALGSLSFMAFLVGALVLALYAMVSVLGASTVLVYATPMVPPNGEISAELSNLHPWVAQSGWHVWLPGLVGVFLAVWGWFRRVPGILSAGTATILGCLLTLHGGAPWFFLVMAAISTCWLIPTVRGWFRVPRKNLQPPAAAVASIVLLGFGLSSLPAKAAEIPPAAAESMVHSWSLRDGRLYGTIEVTTRGPAGSRFLLLRHPAVLTRFDSSSLRVAKAPAGDHPAYWLIAEADGLSSGKAEFEMPLADPAKGWELPAGNAAMRQISLRWNQPGWEFSCPAAAGVSPLNDLPPTESGALLVLGPENPVKLQAIPRQRNAEQEETRYFSEVANLYLPGPGVVNARHLVRIRPSQGRVSSLMLKVPDGFTVSDVADGPVGEWRFDPMSRELRVRVAPAQTQEFSIKVETQRGAAALPVSLDVEPLRVLGAAGEVGTLGLAFGEDVQPEALTETGLSRVNPEDFDASLLPPAEKNQAPATLRHAFRYGADPAKVTLRVTGVAPELRAEVQQLVSLGEDRLVISTDLAVTISRSGVFQLAMDIPEDLEIESATGQDLGHWTEGRLDGKRILTFHLTGKTMGRREFSINLTGKPILSHEKWSVPGIHLREASRETGTLIVVPERGLQVRAVERKNVSQLDPRELSDSPPQTSRSAARPGALAYRLLQGDWSLALSISRLDPWITARVMHEATIREGQRLSRVKIAARIENSAVKSLLVHIPGLDAAASATVRATGAELADLIPVPGKEHVWEMRFRRGLAGETTVELEYQRPTPQPGSESVETVSLPDARQITYFVIVRAAGRLELQPGSIPRGWQTTDWEVAQSTLGALAAGATPSMTYRVADPEGPLLLVIKRHELADLRKLRVSEGSLTTLISPQGQSLTAVSLKLQATAKGVLRLKLPAAARLFQVRVNDEGVPLARQEEDWLFHVSPSPEPGKPALVTFVFSSATTKGQSLEGPVLDVPMENLSWRIIVPEGWRVSRHDGDFDLVRQDTLGSFRLEDYQSLVDVKRRSDAKNAVAMLDQANAWLQAGDQEKAGAALGNAVRNGQLDAASGEDARVQLRQLKTQQAILGLNTRRQKLQLDNRLADPQTAGNPQLDRAAEANPVLRGAYNFNPAQFDRFLEGNSADENSALKEIANRIVSQQLAAEPAPASLGVTLPERGTVLEFRRTVQLTGDHPMSLALQLRRTSTGIPWLAILLCLLAAGLVATRLQAHSRG